MPVTARLPAKPRNTAALLGPAELWPLRLGASGSPDGSVGLERSAPSVVLPAAPSRASARGGVTTPRACSGTSSARVFGRGKVLWSWTAPGFWEKILLVCLERSPHRKVSVRRLV